ncbi:MAG: hypothetical protein ABI112_11400 [Terracoccus sp.]
MGPNELEAARLLERITGGVVFLADHGGRQGIHDLDLRLPDGTLAAVEVTSYARPGHAETAGILAKQEWQWPAVGDRTWSIRVDPAVNLGAFKARYPAIIAAMDQANVAHPEHLPLTTQFEHPDVRWLLHECPMSVTVTAVKTATGEPPRVWVHPGIDSGWVGAHDIQTLPAAVTALLQQTTVAKRIPKLTRAHADEKHLFVHIGIGGLPWPPWYALSTSCQELPIDEPEVPDEVSKLWLTTGNSTVVGWSRTTGWSTHFVPLEPATVPDQL